MEKRRQETSGMEMERQETKARLTTPDLVVLSLLCERPMHGYELLKEYARQEVADWAAVSRPHIYYALKKLATLHLISPRGPSGKENRIVYEPTTLGRNALADALASQSWTHGRPPSPFLTWAGLSIHARPAEASTILKARRAFLVAQIAKEARTLAAIEADEGMRSSIAAHMVKFVIQQFEAEIQLVDEMEKGSSRP
jgi:DNA-binding PadR family transcriptional regulator